MKKQFHKIKIAAENLSRSTKSENKNDELVKIEKQVEKYKDVLEKIYKKFSSTAVGSDQDKEKRIKKVHEYKLGQVLEESAKDLPIDFVLYQVLNKGGEGQKSIASYIVENEIYIENEVIKRLKSILDNDIQEITAQKRNVSRYLQEYNSIKRAYENAQRSNENTIKINQLKLEQEECELKLEKERDLYAAQMFELISKDEIIAYSIRDFIVNQKLFYDKALKNLENNLNEINKIVDTCKKKNVFGVQLNEHLKSTNREISSVIELCVCCLIEKGLNEEGLLRVGCGGTKLKRMKNAINAQHIKPPLQPEYQDIHVIASLLKLYLRELPEPLLTYELYDNFIQAAQYQNDDERKCAILNALKRLPKDNYNNLRYLMKFLWHLCQNHEYNKMSSQNVAIVISPNILWPPENNSDSKDYVGKVNSSAAVNTIVELLVSQWDYFFDGDVEFFINYSRDTLFAETPSSSSITTMAASITVPLTQQPPVTAIHTNHVNYDCSATGGSSTEHNNNNTVGHNVLNEASNQKEHQRVSNQIHSRSNSHDTSRILLTTSEDCLIDRSQSNDSLSSNSSPTYADSPKLPARRKHNKPSAPTPPHKVNQTSITANNDLLNEPNKERECVSSKIEENNDNAQNIHVHGTPLIQKCNSSSQTPPLTILSEKNSAIKPEKPPRPTAPTTTVNDCCSTLNRNSHKNYLNSMKPVALPRTVLKVTKSTENLSSTSTTDDAVQFREKPLIKEKPVIPERPITLMRPTSFRSDEQFQQELIKFAENNNGNNGNGGGISSIKKASSFRISSAGSTPLSQNSNRILNNNLANSTNNLCSTTTTTANNDSSNNISSGQINNRTTLERAQVYNVDKKQVAIIDVVKTSGSGGSEFTTTITATNNCTDSVKSSPKTDNRSTIFGSSDLTNTIVTPSTPSPYDKVPPSPRGFDGNKIIKRPQVPAPPPPTNRRRSDGGLGDSTYL